MTDLERAQDGQAAQGAPVQILADGVLQDGHVGQAVVFGDADVVGEMAQGFRRDAAAAQAGNGGHAGIVPAGDDLIVDKLEQFALAHDGVAQAEAGKFVLMRQGPRQAEVFQNPIVKGPMDLEFQRADAVGDALQVVAQAMGEIVHRINAPFAAGMMMLGVADAVEDGIAHPDVGGGHVDFGPQRARAIGKFARLHPLEKVEGFLDAAFAPGALLAGAVRRAAIGVGVFGGKIADVGLALLNQGNGVLIDFIEIIRGVKRLQLRAAGLGPRRAAR